MKALLAILLCGLPLAAEIPAGFTPIFNHQNIAGWHMSMTSHHGDTTEWRVIDNALTARQNIPGNGGILLTDETYGDVEVYVEIKPDFGCDGGLFLRSGEGGQGYQVMIDYLEGGNVGGVYGERLSGVETTTSTDFEKHWKKGDWNSLRARIEGEVPHIQVWLNEVKITDFQDTANHALGGRTEGHIVLQVHGGERCQAPEGERRFQRFRNIAVKTLD